MAAGDRQAMAETTGYNLKLSAAVAVRVVVLTTLAIGPWLGGAWYGREDLGRWPASPPSGPSPRCSTTWP